MRVYAVAIKRLVLRRARIRGLTPGANSGRIGRAVLIAAVVASGLLTIASPSAAAVPNHIGANWQRESDRVVEQARAHLNQPYSHDSGGWGKAKSGQQVLDTSNPKPNLNNVKNGIDCSAFVWVVFTETGHGNLVGSVRPNVLGLFKAFKKAADKKGSGLSYDTDASKLQPGDIVIFHNYNYDKVGNAVNPKTYAQYQHAAIYTGQYSWKGGDKYVGTAAEPGFVIQATTGGAGIIESPMAWALAASVPYKNSKGKWKYRNVPYEVQYFLHTHLYDKPATQSGGKSVPVNEMIGHYGCGNTPGLVSDFFLDGCSDVLAEDPSGRLWLSAAYRNPFEVDKTRRNKYSSTEPLTLDPDWGQVTDATSSGDMDGDGRPDILLRTTGRTGSTLPPCNSDVPMWGCTPIGQYVQPVPALWLMSGTSDGQFSTPVQIAVAHNWNVRQVFAAGDVDGDHVPDVVAVSVDGRLLLYPGKLVTPVAGGRTNYELGTEMNLGDTTGEHVDWSQRRVFSAGNFASKADIMTVDADGLRLYRNQNGVLSAGQLLPSLGGSSVRSITNAFSPGDFDGDGRADIVVRVNTGRLAELWLLRGDGVGGFLNASAPDVIKTWATCTDAKSKKQTQCFTTADWTPFRFVFSPGRFDGDANPDVLTIDISGLSLYRGNLKSDQADKHNLLPSGRFRVLQLTLPSDVLGFDTPGDFSGDQVPDVLVMDSAGQIWMYPGLGRGKVGLPVAIGGSYRLGPDAVDPHNVAAFMSHGDYDGDGRPDVVVMEVGGPLVLYSHSSTGVSVGSGSALQVGGTVGIASYTGVFSPGNMTGDGRTDFVAVDGQGGLWLYPTTASGLAAPKKIGTGFTGENVLSPGDIDRDGQSDLLMLAAGRLRVYPSNGAPSFGFEKDPYPLGGSTGWSDRTFASSTWDMGFIASVAAQPALATTASPIAAAASTDDQPDPCGSYVEATADPADPTAIAVSTGASDGITPVEVYRVSPVDTVDLGLYVGDQTDFSDYPQYSDPTYTSWSYSYRAVPTTASCPEAVSDPVVLNGQVLDPSFNAQVNGGAVAAPSRGVSVTFSDLDPSITQVRVAESSSDLQSANWVALADSIPYQLSDVDGPHQVFVQARNVSGAMHTTDPIAITLDRVAPVSSLAPLPPSVTASSAVLGYTATDDDGVGVVHAWVRHRASESDAWSDWTQIDDLNGSSGEYSFASGRGYYEFRTSAVDVAGNSEPTPTSDTPGTAATRYVGGIATSANPLATITKDPTLGVSAVVTDPGAGVVSYELWTRYRQDAGSDWSSWILATSSPTASMTLSFTQGEGQYELYTIGVDGAGTRELVPADADASVVYDQTPPESVVMPLDEYLSGSTVSVQYAVSDATGVATVHLFSRFKATATETWPVWTPAATSNGAADSAPAEDDTEACVTCATESSGVADGSFDISLSSGSGYYQFAVQSTDVAGNTEAMPADTDSRVKNVTPPTSHAIGLPAHTSASTIFAGYTSSIGTVTGSVTLYWRYRGFSDADFSQWTPVATSYDGSQFQVNLPVYGRYEFYTVARDSIGQVETKTTADTSIIRDDPGQAPPSSSVAPFEPSTTRSSQIVVSYTARGGAMPLTRVELHEFFQPVGGSGEWQTVQTATSGFDRAFVVNATQDGLYQFFTIACNGSDICESKNAADAGVVLDRVAGPSTIAPLPLSSTAFSTKIAWDAHEPTGTSGLARSTLYYRFKKTSADTWTASWISGGDITTAQPFDFSYPDGPGYYQFCTAITDLAGNAEATPGPSTAPKASTVFNPALAGATFFPVTTVANGSVVATNAVRIVDSRVLLGLSGRLTVGAAKTFQVTGPLGALGTVVPQGAVAITGTLTISDQTNPGFFALTPAPNNTPSTSTVNAAGLDPASTGVTAMLGSDGKLSVVYQAVASSTANVIFDVTGYFLPAESSTGGATYVPISPGRIVDSRDGTGGVSGPIPKRVAKTFQVTGKLGIPATATAVTGSLTVIGQNGIGYFAIGPVATNGPTSSSHSFPGSGVCSTAVTVALDPSGKLSVVLGGSTSLASAHVIFDVTGYFVPGASGASFFGITPTREVDTRKHQGLQSPLVSNTSTPIPVTDTIYRYANAVAAGPTVTLQTSQGFLAVAPGPITGTPSWSNIDFPATGNWSGGLTSGVSADGKLYVEFVAPAGKSTALVLDLTGYFVPSVS